MVQTNKHGGRAGGREGAIGSTKRRGRLDSRERERERERVHILHWEE